MTSTGELIFTTGWVIFEKPAFSSPPKGSPWYFENGERIYETTIDFVSFFLGAWTSETRLQPKTPIVTLMRRTLPSETSKFKQNFHQSECRVRSFQCFHLRLLLWVLSQNGVFSAIRTIWSSQRYHCLLIHKTIWISLYTSDNLSFSCLWLAQLVDVVEVIYKEAPEINCFIDYASNLMNC